MRVPGSIGRVHSDHRKRLARLTVLAGYSILAGCVSDPTVLSPREGPSALPRSNARTEGAFVLPATDVPPLENQTLAIDLRSALRIAAASNLEIQAAKARVAVASALARGRSYPWLPSLDLFAGAGATRGFVQGSFGDVQDVSFGSARAGIDLLWALDPGQAIFDRIAARKLATAEAWRAEASRQDLLLRAFDAYQDLLDARQALGTQDELLSDARRSLQLQKARAGAGIEREDEITGQQIALVSRESERDSARRAFQTSSSRLAQLLGLEPSVMLQPKEKEIAPVDLIDPDAQLADLLAVSDARNPSLEDASQRIEATVAARKAAQWALWSPVTMVTVPLGWVGRSFGELGRATGWGASAKWSVGVQSFAAVDAASARAEVAQKEAAALALDVHGALVRAYVDWRSADERLSHARSSRSLARDRANAAEARLHGGVGRELDWVLARDGLAEARLEEGLAITARARAQARLLAAVGQLDADSLAPGGTPVEESSSSSEGQASVVPLDSTAARLP